MSNINFEEIKQKVFPYFVKIYGEEYSELIYERLNSIIPIFYDTLESKKTRISNLKRHKKLEITFKFLDYIGIPYSLEIADKMLQNNTDNFKELPEIEKFLKFCFNDYANGYNIPNYRNIDKLIKVPKADYQKKEYMRIVKILYPNITDNYDEFVNSPQFITLQKQVNFLSEGLKNFDQEYKNFELSLRPEEKWISQKQQISLDLNNKYTFEFLSSITPYLDSHDKKILENYKNNSPEGSYYSFFSSLNIYQTGLLNLNNNILESFSSNSEQLLSDPTTSSQVINRILSNRQNYERKYSQIIEKNDNFKTFSDSLLFSSPIPDANIVDKILEIRNNIKNSLENDTLTHTSSYEENLQFLLSKEFFGISKEKIDKELKETIDQEEISVSSDLVITNSLNGILKNTPVMFFQPKSFGYNDIALIHEINHAIEMSIVHCDENKTIVKSGFYFEDSSKPIDENYTQFNEVINQLITIEITEAMHKDGTYLFDPPVLTKDRGNVAYEKQEVIVKNFYNTFKNIIRKSRTDNNLSELFCAVGQQNFEDLNDNVNRYASLISQHKYKLVDDIRNNRNTPITQESQELLNNSSQIYQNMLQHYQLVLNPTNSTSLRR